MRAILIVVLMLLSGCSHYGGGTSGTGLNFRDDMSSKSASIRLGASRALDIEGMLLDEKGSPIVNVEVLVESVSDAQTVLVGKKGKFATTISVPPNGKLTFSVPAESESYAECPLPASSVGTFAVKLRLSKTKALTVTAE